MQTLIKSHLGGHNKFRFLHKTFVTQTSNDNINSRIEVYRILYRCHFVESIRFCEVRLCEDLSFNTLCNALAKNIAYTRQARYFYRQREGSLMKKYKYLYDDCLKNFAWLLWSDLSRIICWIPIRFRWI